MYLLNVMENYKEEKTMMKKSNFVRENDKFKGLVDGRRYIVVGSTNGQSVDLQDLLFGDVITVQKAALEKAFVFEGNDTPFPETKDGEYTISNGQLLRNGEKVEQGTLRPITILDYVRNGVYLTVEPKKGETGKELRFYDPEKDEFSVVTKGADSYAVIFNDREVIGFQAWGTRKEKIMPEEEGAVAETVNAVQEMVVFAHGADIIRQEILMNKGFLLHDPNPKAVAEEKATDSTQREETFAYHLFFALDRKVEAKVNTDGELVYTEVESDDCKTDKSLIMKVSIFYDKFRLAGPDTVFPEKAEPTVETQFFTVDGKVRRISPVYNEELDALVVTDQGIAFSNFGYNGPRQAKGQEVLDLVERYPIGLSLWVNRRGNVSVFTLCDEAYNLAAIRVAKTHDRGFITTIKEGWPGFGTDQVDSDAE